VHSDDATERAGIPVTTVARTLFDLAEMLRPRQLERVFDQAEQLQVFDLRDSNACVSGIPDAAR
jgi:hypothetical protein